MNIEPKWNNAKKVTLWLVMIAIPSAIYHWCAPSEWVEFNLFVHALIILGATLITERRRIRQFGLSADGKSIRMCLWAILWATVPFAFILLLAFTRTIEFRSAILPQFYMFVFTAQTIFSSALIEELVMRGVLFQALEKRMPLPLLSVASSLVFAGIHSLNPNLNELAVINIFLANILLNTMFVRSRSLGMTISYHFFWNFSQLFFLGSPISGYVYEPILFRTNIDQLSPIIFGSSFGFEGGIVCTFVLILTTVIVAKMTNVSPMVSALIYKEQYGKKD